MKKIPRAGLRSSQGGQTAVPRHISSKIEWLPLVTLKAFPKNPRKHPEKQLAYLERSITRFGVTNPILLDESRTILAGHARFEVARRRNLEVVPTLTIRGLSDAEKRSLVVADNRVAELAVWDIPELKTHFEVLLDSNFDVELTGFSTGEVDLMLDGASPDQDADDECLEPQTGPTVSKLGDVWELGRHRLLCGDACAKDSYKALLGDDLAQMACVDPPFNVPIANHVAGRGRIKHREFVQASGEMSPAQFVNFLTNAMRATNDACRDGSISFWFMDWRGIYALREAADACGLVQKALITWVKNNAGQGSFYRSQHELIAVFKKGSAPHVNNFGLGAEGRYRTNVWRFPSVNSLHPARRGDLELHPTVKPTAMIADAIRDCSKRNAIVLDSFGGSGTTIIAAERTGRIARVVELDPAYVDIAIERWQRRTGGEARLLRTGAPYNELRARQAEADDKTDANEAELKRYSRTTKRSAPQ